MAETQRYREIAVATPLGDDVLLLKSISGTEQLGRPFEFPDSYIEFIAFLKIGFKLPYRMVQGAVRALSKVIRI